MGAIAELAAYLGKNYEPSKLNWPHERLMQELARHKGNWLAFQRSREALYLYARREDNDEWWLPHLHFLNEVRAERRPGTVLEAHAVTGWFGVRAGADAYADYQSKATEFLHWRLKLHKSKAQVYDLGKGAIPRHGLAFAFNAAHLYADPLELVDRLASLGSIGVLDLDGRRLDAPATVARIGERYDIFKMKTVNYYAWLVAFNAPASVETETTAPVEAAVTDKIEDEE